MLVHTLDRREPNLRRIALAQLRTKRSGDNLMRAPPRIGLPEATAARANGFCAGPGYLS